MHEQDGRADSVEQRHERVAVQHLLLPEIPDRGQLAGHQLLDDRIVRLAAARPLGMQVRLRPELVFLLRDVDRKSTRLNSSHQIISYAVFCLKKKKNRL